MNVFLKQISPEHEVFRCRIEAGQRFTIGGSELANRRIRGDRPLPDVCAVLEVSQATCTLTNVAPGRVPVSVNGQPAQLTQLRNGDKIQIGPAAFTVTWKQITPSSQPAGPSPIVFTYSGQYAPSGLRQYLPGPESWPVSRIVEQLSGKLAPILFVNATAAGLRHLDAIKSLPDLYEHAPEEIRRSHSLQAIVGQPVEKMLKIYDLFHNRDAATWAFVDGDSEAALYEARLYVAWFARPSSLRLHLDQGSHTFLDGLTKPFAAICFRPQTGGDWIVYTRPETRWNAVGFEKPPANPG